MRVVAHPEVSLFRTDSPMSAWLIHSRIDVLWDPRTTPGCQASIRILRSTDGGKTWGAHSDWTSAKEYDGNITVRVVTIAVPGTSSYIAQWTVDCPPNPLSGQAPYRRTMEYGIPARISAPRLSDGYGQVFQDTWGTNSGGGAWDGSGDWGRNGYGGGGDWNDPGFGGYGGGSSW